MPETTDVIIKRQELAEAPPAVGMMPVSRITPEDRSRMRALGELLANSYHQGQFRKMPWPDNFNKETPEIRRAYREMLRDGTIRSAFYSKILSVASLDVQVMPADDSPAAQRVADFVKWNLTQSTLGGFPKIVRSILEGGCSEGYSLCEPRIDIQRRGKYRLMYTLQKFKGKDSKLFDLEVDNFDEITSVYVKATNRRVNPDRFVIWSYLSMFEAVIGSSDFRACYREFLIIDVAMKMAAIDVERFVLPMMKGTYKESDQKELMEEALRTARSLGFAALPDGATIEAIQLATAGPDRIDARIKMCQANVFTAMTGASLQAMEGQKTGSLAQGRVHQNQSQLPVWFLANEVAEVLKSQLVPALVDLNFGDECDLPQVVVSGVDDAATTGFADLVEKAQRMGLKPSRKDVAKRMGIQEAQTPEDELVPSAPGGTGGTGMGGMPPIGSDGPTDQQMGIFSQKRRKSKSRGRCVRYSSIAICGDGLSGDEDEDDGDDAVAFSEKKKYSSTQFNLPDKLASQVIALAAQVKDEHLTDHGREDEPHITAKYGLHADNPFQLRALLAGFGPVYATIAGISLFENPDADVIKIDIESDDLHRLNSLITSGMECTETRGEYCPHITIAYVKPGIGRKYLGLNTQGLSGTLIGLDQLKFSNVDREKTTIFLSTGTITAFAQYRGPKPPGDPKQWKLIGTGPRGGKIWESTQDQKTPSKEAEIPKPEVSKSDTAKEPNITDSTSVQVEIQDEKETKAVWKELMPNHPPEHAASLVGAMEGAKVRVSKAGDSIIISVSHPDYECSRSLGRDDEGKLYIGNMNFGLTDLDKRGSGIGAKVFSEQVRSAKAAGVSYIRATAVGKGDGKTGAAGDGDNGYYTWARFGYDLPIKNLSNAKQVTAAFPQAKSIMDVMATKEGQQWWKINGVEMRRAQFDLTDNSRSMQVMNAYREEKAKLKTANHSAGVSESAELSVRDEIALSAVWTRIEKDGWKSLSIVGRHRAKAFAESSPTAGGSLQTNLVAASGQDERRVLKLLRTARDEGTKLLLNLARTGLKQGLASRDSSNFIWTQEQRGQLAQFFTSLLTTGEMLGRSRIRLRADQWIRRGRVRGFSEPTDFSVFSSPPGIMPAEEAIRYFNSLVPSLNVTPSRVLPSLERSAFTLAITTQHQIQTMIQRVIGQKLETGRTDGAQVIDDILKSVGLSPKNPQYAEMTLRTNSMDAWNVGQDRERQTPEMMVAFPVWQYVGIADGRERSWHAVHFDKYFPAAMSFVQVRDSVKVSPFNCRCSSIPIDRSTWSALQEQGAILSTM